MATLVHSWRSEHQRILFALLFVAAENLPGGVAATVGAIQPLLTSLLAARIVAERLTVLRVVAALVGIVGVILVVNQNSVQLNFVGVCAALGAATLTAVGMVLTKRWGQTSNPIVMTSWQLIAGGIILVPITLSIEGLPSLSSLTSRNMVGFSYFIIVQTVLAYTIWFRGIKRLPVSLVGFLGLLSPCMAVACGWLFLNQMLSLGQVAGVIVILGAVLCVNWEAQRRYVRTFQPSVVENL